MKVASLKAETVEGYIRKFTPEIQQVLKALRRAITAVAPDAEESISYGMPTYKIRKRPLVYFAGYQRHVSVYPATERSVAPLARLAPYRSGRGTLKFPLGTRLPLALLKQFVRLRLKEELARLAETSRVPGKASARTGRRGSSS